MPSGFDSRGWFGPAAALVAAVTALRWALLAFDRTDLFVDESQYWLWGQSFEFGYYSKPPLIAWVIGAVTGLAGSDAPFFIRLPGAALHGATALILGALAARVFGRAAALWTVAAYLSLPMVAVGSLLISTDTVMAPFFAAALLFHRRLSEAGAARWALLAGAMAGLAFLAKYAAVYFLLGAALGALVWPAFRIGWRNGGLMVLAFALVAAPNLAWNMANRLATLSHTVDNVGWLREDSPLAGLNPAGMAEFLASQFAVMGPVLFGALVLALRRPGVWGTRWHGLPAFILPALAIVTFQALMEKAYANWAASAYFAATPLVVAYLLDRPLWLKAGVGLNALVCVLLPLLTLSPWTSFGLSEPPLSRYLGRADLSRQIITLAEASGTGVIVADRRDILADLFHTGRDSGLDFFAVPPAGRPENHYEQRHALPPGTPGPVLFVGRLPKACAPLAPTQPLTTTGSWQGVHLSATLIEPGCLNAAE